MDPNEEMIKAFESGSDEAKTSRSAGDSDEEKSKSSHSISEKHSLKSPHKLPSIPKRSKYFQKSHNTRENAKLIANKKPQQKNSVLKIPVIKEDDGLVSTDSNNGITKHQKEESVSVESESQKSNKEIFTTTTTKTNKKKSAVSIRALPFKKKSVIKSPPIKYCGQPVQESDIIGKTTFSSEEATEEISIEVTEEEEISVETSVETSVRQSITDNEEATVTELKDKEETEAMKPPRKPSPTSTNPSAKQEYIQQQPQQATATGGGTFFRPLGSKLPSIPDYDSLSLIEQAHHRASFVTRFNTLRRSWPDANIPFVDMNKSLGEIHVEYDTYINDIHVTRCVNKYKFWMVILWVSVEVFARRMDLDMEGFALAAYESMSDYDRLLIELGEINNQNVQLTVNGTAASNWPIEVQLIYNTLYYAAGFLLLKFLTQYLPEGIGKSIIEEVKNVMGHNPAPKGPAQPVYVQQTGVPLQQTDQHGVPFMPKSVPEPPSAAGGFMDAVNVPKLIATMGPNMFCGGKKDVSSQGPPKDTNNSDTSRFQPMYAE
jgi:hypothetical protein